MGGQPGSKVLLKDFIVQTGGKGKKQKSITVRWDAGLRVHSPKKLGDLMERGSIDLQLDPV